MRTKGQLTYDVETAITATSMDIQERRSIRDSIRLARSMRRVMGCL
jgi:hypothetical protein